MQYALLIYSKPGTAESLTEAERESLSREYYALRDEPGMLGGAGLQTADPVDWRQVAALYAELAELTGSPVVRLNGAVAIAAADGPAAALAIVDGLPLAGYQYWHSTRAELLRRLGRPAEARAAYRAALDLATAEPERRFLAQRIAECGG